eukprot:scpid107685/ scgid0741/ 
MRSSYHFPFSPPVLLLCIHVCVVRACVCRYMVGGELSQVERATDLCECWKQATVNKQHLTLWVYAAPVSNIPCIISITSHGLIVFQPIRTPGLYERLGL